MDVPRGKRALIFDTILGAVCGIVVGCLCGSQGHVAPAGPPPAAPSWFVALWGTGTVIALVLLWRANIPAIRPFFRVLLGLIVSAVLFDVLGLIMVFGDLLMTPMRTFAGYGALTGFVVAWVSGDNVERAERSLMYARIVGGGISGAVIAGVAGWVLGAPGYVRAAMGGVDHPNLPLALQPDNVTATVGFIIGSMQAMLDSPSSTSDDESVDEETADEEPAGASETEETADEKPAHESA